MSTTRRLSPVESAHRVARNGSRAAQGQLQLGRDSGASPDMGVALDQAGERARHQSAFLRPYMAAGLETGLPTGFAASESSAARPHERSSGTTLMDLCTSYVTFQEARGRRSWARTCRLDVETHIAPCPWADAPAQHVSVRAILELLRAVRARSTAHTANRIRTLLMAAYELPMRQPYDPSVGALPLEILSNPVRSTRKLRTDTRPLGRALSLHELGAVWRRLTTGPSSDAVTYRFVRISVLLGGQRCSQLLAVRSGDVDVDSRTLSLVVGKDWRDRPTVRLFPLSPLVWDEIWPLLQRAAALNSPYLFPGRGGDRHMDESVISRAVRQMSAALLQAGKLAEPFCYRDLRYTAAARMLELEIGSDLCALIQSYRLNFTFMRHYNFLPQMSRALERWQHDVLECAKATDDTAPEAPQGQPPR